MTNNEHNFQKNQLQIQQNSISQINKIGMNEKRTFNKTTTINNNDVKISQNASKFVRLYFNVQC